MKMRKKLLAGLMAAVLLVTGSGTTRVRAEEAAADSQEPRTMQQKILDWKCPSAEAGELLTGDLLDGAGQAASDWFAFDIGRIGNEDKNNQAAYLARLEDVVEKIYQEMAEDSATVMREYRLTDLHRMVLTIEACGGDSTAFGSDPEGNSIDLINDSVWNSLWGDPGDQGINGYIWSLLAVDSQSYQEPEDAQWTRETLLTELLSRQLEDGGFGLTLKDASDVDLTSMALTALAPYGDSDQTYTFTSEVSGEEVTTTVDQAAEKAFARLSDLQGEDGSMMTYEERTSESTSWTMMALASWNRDPGEDEQFIKNGNSLIDGLQAFQLADGGIIHSLDGDEEETEGNTMAGYQAIYGLEAVCRLREGKCRVFDLSDAPTVTADEVEEAAASLPELVQEEEKTGSQVQEETSNRMIYLTAGIAAAVVVVVVVFLVLALRDKKKKQNPLGSGAPSGGDGEDEDEDDDW